MSQQSDIKEEKLKNRLSSVSSNGVALLSERKPGKHPVTWKNKNDNLPFFTSGDQSRMEVILR